MKKLLFGFLFLFILSGCFSEEQSVNKSSIWVKGNTHMHSTVSDGDASPEQALKWYKDHRYDFAVLTDHNKIADTEIIESMTDDKFVAILGEEITPKQNDKYFAVHLNALGISEKIDPLSDGDRAKILKDNFDLISKSGGIVQLNHPSFNLASPEAIKGIKGKYLIEIFNYSAANEKGIGRLAQIVFEQAWDNALSYGHDAYGVAADDAHDYVEIKSGKSNPGGGWIMVNVEKLGRDEILKSIRDGKFYSSTGVSLKSTGFDKKTFKVEVDPDPKRQYVIDFIGKDGKVLSSVKGAVGEYKISGIPEEMYVRARVTADNKTCAWTQAVYPNKE